jgi:disulfide bond formation protein DsbB
MTMASAGPQVKPALILAAGTAATVLTALAFQHIGGYMPCMLCYIERDPYYFSIPVAIGAAAASYFKAPAWVSRALLGLVLIAMLIGGGIATYHAGAEWGFWEGPSACASPVDSVTTNAGNLLNDLNAVHGPSCTQAALRILGLSFAGWNVLASLLFAGIAFWGMRRK